MHGATLRRKIQVQVFLIRIFYDAIQVHFQILRKVAADNSICGFVGLKKKKKKWS